MSTALLGIIMHSVEERHGPYYSLGIALNSTTIGDSVDMLSLGRFYHSVDSEYFLYSIETVH